MVDVIALVDWLEIHTNSAQMYHLKAKSFEETLEEAMSLEGTRFPPRLMACLRNGETAEKLRTAFEEGTLLAYRRMYEDALPAKH